MDDLRPFLHHTTLAQAPLPLHAQVGPTTVTPIATSAILQLAVATPSEGGSLLAAHRPLLAARSAYNLSVLELEQGEGADEGDEGWVAASLCAHLEHPDMLLQPASQPPANERLG